MLSHEKSMTAAAVAVLAAVLLSACGTTPPTQFYTLASSADAADALAPTRATAAKSGGAAASTSAAPQGQTFIEVMPVAVPERLARPQLVLRSDVAKVDVLETERWSSPFNSELRDALAAAVADRLGAVDISRSGRPADQVSYRIAVELRDMDAARNGQVRADFGWTITRSDDRKTAVCRMRVAEQVAGGATSDVVLAMQKMVADTAGVIAGNVRTLQAGQPATCRD